MLLQDPFFEPGFILVQRQIPVFGLLQNGLTAADGGDRINQVGGTQRGPTLFALVSIGTWISAMGTGSGNVAVGQKGGSLLIVILLRCLFNKNTFIVKSSKYFRSGFMMDLVGGAGVDVEGDPKITCNDC